MSGPAADVGGRPGTPAVALGARPAWGGMLP
jgi:hypothetical protein